LECVSRQLASIYRGKCPSLVMESVLVAGLGMFVLTITRQVYSRCLLDAMEF